MNFRPDSPLKAALWSAIDLLLPPRCPACGEIVAGEAGFCRPCWSTLSFITAPLCDGCGEPFELPQPDGSRCGACLATPRRFAAARAALAYEGAARDVVLSLKHGDRPHLAALMAGHLARAGAEWLSRPDALIVPVPLHRWRLWRRGYNQAALLARALAARTSTALCVDALDRVKPTPVSKGMTRRERAANVRGAFRIAPRRAQVAGACIVLVDDVLTSGATADACARILLRAGAREVVVLTWARVARVPADGHI